LIGPEFFNPLPRHSLNQSETLSQIFSKLADNEDFALRLELRTAPRAGVGRRISRIAPLRERDYDRLVYSNNFSSFRVVNPSTYAQLRYDSHAHDHQPCELIPSAGFFWGVLFPHPPSD
jgi:hypothetical protein